MASTNLLTFAPSGIRASASSAGRKRPDPNRRSFSPAAAAAPSSSSGWWTPLFGWPSEPDYIDSGSGKADRREEKVDPELDPSPARPSRFAPGGFTAEKAKQLRMMTQGGAGPFHDAMYHSAIASRLASDFGGRPDL